MAFKWLNWKYPKNYLNALEILDFLSQLMAKLAFFLRITIIKL